MEMLSIAVCDDETAWCCQMAGKLKGILDGMKEPCIIRQFNSGKELLQTMEDFDLIFLDIIMRDLNGMRTAKLLRGKMKREGILVFVSSSREYALEAFEAEAFQYLLKPVDEKKLRRVLERVIAKTEVDSQEFIIVNKEREKKKLFLDNICYFEVIGRKIDVHMTDGVFTYYGQLGTMEKNLRQKGFFRCHKSYLIHLKYVNSYTRREVILDNGERILLAKRRYEEFGKEILAYMRIGS